MDEPLTADYYPFSNPERQGESLAVALIDRVLALYSHDLERKYYCRVWMEHQLLE